jgi:hypothetical protein
LTLTDAGPLIAILNRADTHHAACVGAVKTIQLPMVTTWPVLTEVMYLVSNPRAQARVWQMVEREQLTLFDLDAALTKRTATLMAKYEDVPMDLADATLVAVAENLKQRRIFTVDRTDFSIYRLNGRTHFEIFP